MEYLANNAGANRMHRLVCVFVFRTEQSQVFSWRGMGELKAICMRKSRVGTGGPTSPLENHENIGFLSNTGPDPLKNHKATKPAFNVGLSSARQ